MTKTFIVIDCVTGAREMLQIEPVKVTPDNWLEVYGLVPTGQSLVARAKQTYEVGENVGLK